MSIDQWPQIYQTFFEKWPEAFEFYRHNAFSYVSKLLGYMPLGTALESVLRRAKALDEDGYVRFIDALVEGAPRFSRQRTEATRYIETIPEPGASLAHLRSALYGYASLYEIDFPLWFLGVVSRALNGQDFDPNLFGGSGTKTSQASLISSIEPFLEDTPLKVSFDLAYDSGLRNAIAHNDFELAERGREVVIIDHGSGHEWTEDEVWERLVHAQFMHHAVVLASQVAIANRDQALIHMADVGVLSFTWAEIFDGWPLVVVPQLWCFRDLDPVGSWIDASQLTITLKGNESSSALTDAATATGPGRPSGDRWEAATKRGWAWVVRIPVAPNLTLGYPEIETVEKERYEVVGAADVHLIPLRVID